MTRMNWEKAKRKSLLHRATAGIDADGATTYREERQDDGHDEHAGNGRVGVASSLGNSNAPRWCPRCRVMVIRWARHHRRVHAQTDASNKKADVEGVRSSSAVPLHRRPAATSAAAAVFVRDPRSTQVGLAVAEGVMTTAETLRREGETRGKRGALLLLLPQRFGDLSAGAIARIDNASTAELDGWFLRVFAASSLEELLGLKTAVPPNKAMQPTRALPRSPRQRTRG